VTLTAARMIARHLTPENHTEVLAAARRRTKVEIEALVARLAPKPDAKAVIRRLADPRQTSGIHSATPAPDADAAGSKPDEGSPAPAPPVSDGTHADGTGTGARPAEAEVISRPAPARRPVIRTSAPARFLVQLTVGQETHDRFRRLQALCARECHGGDPVAVFDLVCLVAEKEMRRRKRADVTPARRGRGKKAAAGGDAGGAHSAPVNGRHVPADVSRAVWARDGERCAFVGPAGRCTETKFLELHHRIPWVLGGPATIDNLAVRCRLHNVYEAELAFGARAIRPSPRPGDTSPNAV
jgi:HNH endonuclease